MKAGDGRSPMGDLHRNFLPVPETCTERAAALFLFALDVMFLTRTTRPRQDSITGAGWLLPLTAGVAMIQAHVQLKVPAVRVAVVRSIVS